MRLGYQSLYARHNINLITCYSFQASPVLLSRALQTLTFKMRFLCFKTQSISQAKSKQACVLLQDQKKTEEMFYLFYMKVNYLTGQLRCLRVVVKPGG